MAKKIEEVIIPNQTDLLMQAINCDNQDTAKLLIQRAMSSIYPRDSWRTETWKDEELNAVITLIRGISPKDMIEGILATQYVTLHLKAMAIIAEGVHNRLGQGMMMLRLSHQALATLQQYRGKCQTINVNYNVHSEGNTVLNTMIRAGAKLKNE